MNIQPIPLIILTIVWALLTLGFYRSRRWLTFYLTGAFGFVLLAFSILRALGFDSVMEALEVRQVLVLAEMAGLAVEEAAATSIGIQNHVGWSVFDVGIECSGLLEILAFVGLVFFYPGFSVRRKGATLAIGIAATWIINLLRILLIIAIIAFMGTGWVFQAHAIFGRVFFFVATIGLYWYLVTRPTITIVGNRLGAREVEADG